LDGDRPLGKGVYIEDYEVIHQGKWSAQQEKYSEEPSSPMAFTSFDPLDTQVIVDEGALGEERWEKAYDSGFAFLAAMGFAPDWRAYGSPRAIQASYAAEEAGGGPVTQEMYVKETDRWLYTPLAEDFWDYLDRVADAAWDGAEVGGYIKIKGLSMTNTEGDALYADIVLYCTAGEQGYSFLKSINGTDQSLLGDAGLMWADVSSSVTGLARIITYREKVNPYATTYGSAGSVAEPEWEMLQLFEGAVKDGRCKAKFGRLMTNNGDNFFGYLTGDPVEGIWGAMGKGVWYKDMELQAQGVWQSSDARGLKFEDALWFDEEHPDKFVWWDFWSFEKEDIPYDVLYEEESGCRWNDGTCFYWAYQYSVWGTSRLPEWLTNNKYYVNGGATAEAADMEEGRGEDEEEEEWSEWEEPDYGTDFDFEKEEEWTDADWEEYEFDFEEFDFGEYENFDFGEFEEDLGFYGWSDDEEYYWDDMEGSEWATPSDWDMEEDGDWEYDPYNYEDYEDLTRPSDEYADDETWENFEDDSWFEDNEEW